MSNNKMEFLKDPKNKKVVVKRYFDAEQHEVWRAWTDSRLLDLWWAPLPWRAETKSQDFKVGGYWLYAMVGPEGERHWARINYTAIQPESSFSGTDVFCDENGNPNSDLPGMNWTNSFQTDGKGTMVTVDILFKSEEDIEKIVAMGFEEGFTSALTNLDHYFNTLSKARK